MFYSNEHEPVHVHGKCQGRESKAEVIVVNGINEQIKLLSVSGRSPLTSSERHIFEEIVTAKADDIVKKWIDYFVLHKAIAPETITRRVK